MSTTTLTLGEMLSQHDIAVPDHLEAAMTIATAERWVQGDIYYMPYDGEHQLAGEVIPSDGIKVVTGDADRNSHILDCDHPDARWHPGVVTDEVADYGLVVVPEVAVAYLTHTDEHGSIAMPPGTYRLWGQVSYEDELRRVED